MLLVDIFRCIFFIEIYFIESGIHFAALPNVEMPFILPAKVSQPFIWKSESCLYDREILDRVLRLTACAGVVMLLCCDFEERMVLPFVLRAVTPFTEPEKSQNAMDGLTIIVSDLVKQPCDSEYKYTKLY